MKHRPRAPWRWRWGRILGLLLRCGAWALALRWSPFFGAVLGFWVYAQLRAQDPHPLPSPIAEEGPEDKEADERFAIEQDPDHPNRWKVTHRE